MPKKSMTVEDVKKAKIELEKSILKMVNAFEKDTSVRITYISLDRKRDVKEMAEPVPERRGPVVNVDANMELDLVY